MAERLARGEIEAIEWLYDQYGRLAYRLAVGILRDQQAAEDVVQEAYLALWRRAATFDPGRGSIRSWLLTIVHNRAIDHLRSGAHRKESIGLETTTNKAAADDPEQTAVMNDDRARIRNVLMQLPQKQRRTLELSYFGGLSHGEIAEKLGLPLGTVKGRMRSGLGRMRLILQSAEAC